MPKIADIAALEALRWDGLLSSDTEALSLLMHGDLAYTHSNGMVDTKDVFLERLRSGALRYLDIETSEQRIRIHGETAVVYGLAVLHIQAGEQQFSTPIRYTAIWACSGRQSQHVAWHSSPATV